MVGRIVSTVLFVALALSAQAAFPHDTEHHAITEEILEELQALSEDLEPVMPDTSTAGMCASLYALTNRLFGRASVRFSFYGTDDFPSSDNEFAGHSL